MRVMVPNDENIFTTDLTAHAKSRPSEHESLAVPPGFEDLAYVFDCTFGHYPWDDWERDALAAGVPVDLAGLGRLTMREAFQHDWDARLKSLCGWRDQGRRMIKLALRSPETARKRWNRLLDTDGYRGEYDAQSGEWKSWI